VPPGDGPPEGYERDPGKAERDVALGRPPFELAELVLEGRPVIWEDLRQRYTERRLVAVGEIEGKCYVLVYTLRPSDGGEVKRVISLRRANRRETRDYQAERER